MTFKIEERNWRNQDEWNQWRSEWKAGYKELSEEIKRTRLRAKNHKDAPRYQSLLRKFQKPMAWKMLTFLDEAKKAWNEKKRVLAELNSAISQYPLQIENAREVIFHFNKAHNQHPDIPAWVVKTKGKTWYIKNLTTDVGFTTKETPDNTHTKGALRFRKVNLRIDGDGNATITKLTENGK